MGTFTYDRLLRADFEDRALWHLHVVIGNKLRRGESFHFSWKDDSRIGDGSSAVWIHPNCSIMYRFHHSQRPPLNRAWLDALTRSANSPTGLALVAEPLDPVRDVSSTVAVPVAV